MTIRPVGERPSAIEIAQQALAESVAQRRVIAELVARLEALERVGADEDGPAPQQLPSNWRPIKRAALAAGYAGESGIRAAIERAKRNGAKPWWCHRGSRIWVDLDRCPRRR